MIVPKKETIRLRLPDLNRSFRVEITGGPTSTEHGYVVAVINGQKKHKWEITNVRNFLYSFDVEADKDGIAEISLEFIREKKSRIRENQPFIDRIRIFDLTVKDPRRNTPHSR